MIFQRIALLREFAVKQMKTLAQIGTEKIINKRLRKQDNGFAGD